MTDPFGKVEIPRDRWQRPLVIPAGGGKPVAFTRCTTYVGCLEDTYNLGKWQQRMTAIGLAARPDLLLAAVAHKDEKDRLNDIVEQAVEAAKASAAATTGTALHSLTEQLDRGTLDIDTVPAAYQPDLRAYQEATAGCTVLDIEQFMVLDALKIGGTPDRRVMLDGRPYILDLKTGSIEYGMGKIAMQISVYAHCQNYDIKTGERTEVEVDTERGIIAHLPAGTGTCVLYWVDIEAGWEAVDLARQVREWRKRRGLHSPLEQQPDAPLDPDPILSAIAAATEVGQLRELWAANHATRWTDVHTKAAAQRKDQIINDTQGVLA